jgi:hypothetical protein
MALIAEDVTFSISEDVEFALPMVGSEAVGGDIAEWLAEAGLSEADIEADVGTWLSNMGSGALNFGTAGASIGGPWGALIGGLLGAGLGAVQAATTPDKPPAGQAPPPQPAAAKPAAPPPEKPPLRTIQNQPDTPAVLSALRDALPALTLIAQQLSKARTESAEDVAAAPEVAEDWSLEQEWPYAQEGVEVAEQEAEATAEGEVESAAEAEAEAEDAAEGEAESPAEAEDVPAEQLVPSGEAYAGAALARIGEET